jgi:ParB/RepB/Spo0J family partition protein
MPKPAPHASPETIAQQIRTPVHGESATIQGSMLTAPAPDRRTTVSQDIVVKDIDPRGTNVRSHMDPHELNNLVESIRQHGLIEPVLVQALPKSRGYRYRLIAGFRRVTACRLVPLTIIPARVIEGALEETEVQQLQLTENLHRESMTIHDIVASIEALRAAGLTQQQVADPELQPRQGAHLSAVRHGHAGKQEIGLGITQFQAAAELLTKARRKLGTFPDDPALQAEAGAVRGVV